MLIFVIMIAINIIIIIIIIIINATHGQTCSCRCALHSQVEKCVLYGQKVVTTISTFYLFILFIYLSIHVGKGRYIMTYTETQSEQI